MTKKKRRLSKKNRNTISGLLVGVASLYAVSTYMEVPQQELNRFLLTTIMFFVLIMILAGLAISVLKFLIRAKKSIKDSIHENETHTKESQDKERE